MKVIKIDPVTRISGALGISAYINDSNIVSDAKAEGLLFRGFENMLLGRNPFDAVYFTQRICGICSTAHSMAAAIALENALGIIVTQQGRYLRDIVHGCEFLQNHIRHFYQYTVPDYVSLPKGNILFEANHNDFRIPKKKNELIVQHYFESLEISRSAHEMLAVLGGKAPHNHGIFVGGITTQATIENINNMCSILKKINHFIINKMLPDAHIIAEYYSDYFEMGRSYGNFISFGCFNSYKNLGTLYVNPLVYSNGITAKLNSDKITENIHSSWYKDSKETYNGYILKKWTPKYE